MQAGVQREERWLRAPEQRGWRSKWGRDPVLNHFPDAAQQPRLQGFGGGNLFSKFLDLSSPSPAGRIGLDQCPQGSHSAFQLSPSPRSSPWTLFSASGSLSCPALDFVFLVIGTTNIFSCAGGEEIFPSRLQLSGRGRGLEVEAALHSPSASLPHLSF